MPESQTGLDFLIWCWALYPTTAISLTRAPSQYPKRRLFVRSREISKPRDWYFKLSYRFEIWQAHRQHCCRSACQISERSDNSKYKSSGFETLRDLTERRLFAFQNKDCLSRYGYFHYKDKIAVIMGIPILIRWYLYIEMAHCFMIWWGSKRSWALHSSVNTYTSG